MHTCHAIDCKLRVPPEMFMCKKHWFSLPPFMRAAIYRGYRVGQCDDQNPSAQYCQQAVDCIRYIAERERKQLTGSELELRLYAQFHTGLTGVTYSEGT